MRDKIRYHIDDTCADKNGRLYVSEDGKRKYLDSFDWIGDYLVEHIEDIDPRDEKDFYWLIASNKKDNYPATKDGGKWLIFVPPDDIKDVWMKIKKAIEDGRLGNMAKISTGKNNRLGGKSKNHVICVYTYDYEDKKDVIKIREQLRKIGITQKIPYKTNKATRQGKYSIHGDKKISEYFI